MENRVAAIAVSICLFFVAILPARADDVQSQIELSRTAYARGDALRALSALQMAVAAIGQRLSDQLGRMTPPPLAGWDAAPPEFQSLDSIGGGVTVTRGYTKDAAALNASLIFDNPAVGGTLAMFDSGSGVVSQPGWSRVKVGGDDALLRFDTATRAGEILMVVGNRALLQIEGTDIARGDILVDAAKGWNTTAIRKLLGPSPGG